MLPGSPAIGFSRQHDARTRHCVCFGIVVTERNPEPSANVGQFRRTDPPLRAGELHGANKPRARRGKSVPGTASVQYTPVERRVVGGDKGRAGDPGTERRPQFSEGRRTSDGFPIQAVDVGKRKLPGGRPDQVGS